MNGAWNIQVQKRAHPQGYLIVATKHDYNKSYPVSGVAARIGCTSCPSGWPCRSCSYLVSSWPFGAFVSQATWHWQIIYSTFDTRCRIYALWNKNILILSGLLSYLTTQIAIGIWVTLLPGAKREILLVSVILFSSNHASALSVPLQNYEFHCKFLQSLFVYCRAEIPLDCIYAAPLLKKCSLETPFLRKHGN